MVKMALIAWNLGLGRMTLNQNIFNIDRLEFFLVFPPKKAKKIMSQFVSLVPLFVFEIRFLPPSPKITFL